MVATTANPQSKNLAQNQWLEFGEIDRIGFEEDDYPSQDRYIKEEVEEFFSQGLSSGSVHFEYQAKNPEVESNNLNLALENVKEEIQGVVEVTSPLLLATGEGIISIAKDTPDALVDLFKMFIGKPTENSRPKESKQKSENAQKQDEDKIKQAEVNARQNRIMSDLQRVQENNAIKAASTGKRLKINSLLELQALYQGSVDKHGNILAYYETQAEEKEKSLEKEEIRKKRDMQMTQAAGKGKGAVVLDAVAEGGTGGGKLNLSSTGGGGVG